MKYWPSATLVILSPVRTAPLVDRRAKGITNAFVPLAITESYANPPSTLVTAILAATLLFAKFWKKDVSGIENYLASFHIKLAVFIMRCF